MEPTKLDIAIDRIEREYDMPAVDVVRFEAETANYPLRLVAGDLGLSEHMLRRFMRINGIEWNRTKSKNSGDMPQYTLRIDL